MPSAKNRSGGLASRAQPRMKAAGAIETNGATRQIEAAKMWFIRMLRTFSANRWWDSGSHGGFFKACLRCPKGEKKATSGDGYHQRPEAPLAHQRPEYPLSGCVPAEPDSVYSGPISLPRQWVLPQPPLDIGVMP